MSTTEETPAQRQARIRREKRDAKIKSTGQDRLDKITMLSGRTPESIRNGSQAASPAASPAPSPQRPATPTPMAGPTAGPEQLQAQEEYIRALLRTPSSDPNSPQLQGGTEQEDPMMTMLQSMLGAANGDPNAAPMPSLNPDDIAKATGLPSFVTNMIMGKTESPPTPEQQKEARTWIIVHILFALAAGLYMLFTIDRQTTTFGAIPPAPATFQNPVPLFVVGEAILHGSRLVLSNTPRKGGPGFWIQSAKELARDASVMIFTLGVYSWWQGLA